MNSASHTGPYQRDIIQHLGCTPQDAAMVEDIMRRFVFHSTLDWQSREELNRGAEDAWAVLEEDREMFEADFAARQRMFNEMKTQEAVEAPCA
jgi:hypothetical protein